MEIIKNIGQILWIFIPAVLAFSLMIFVLFWKDKPWLQVYESNEWLSIEEHPLPLDYERTYFLVTNGKEIEIKCARYINYNRLGKPLFLGNELITHWAPMPKPPEL
jgi:hypothetical protein